MTVAVLSLLAAEEDDDERPERERIGSVVVLEGGVEVREAERIVAIAIGECLAVFDIVAQDAVTSSRDDTRFEVRLCTRSKRIKEVLHEK